MLLNDVLQLSDQGILQKSTEASLPDAISEVLIWSQKFMREKKVMLFCYMFVCLIVQKVRLTPVDLVVSSYFITGGVQLRESS